MKKLCNIILALTIFACLALPFAGCDTYKNSENCGGIVKGYNLIGETEIKIPFTEDEYYTALQIEIEFKDKSNKFYPYTFVSQVYYDYYNCSTVEELFKNEDFIKTYSTTMLLEVKNGKAILEINKKLVLSASVYFYEGINENISTTEIEDFTNYIGYFNYN